MRSFLGHLLYNVDPANLPFYRELFGFLGWTPVYEGDGMLGVGAGSRESIWFGPVSHPAPNHYDGPGLNHLGIGVDAIRDVDATADYLRQQGIELLFETPRHRPEFSGGEDQTYYQVMFASPDGLLFEVVYIGAKDAPI